MSTNPSSIESPMPRAAVLVGQSEELALVPDARSATRVREQDQREKTSDLSVVGRRLCQHRARSSDRSTRFNLREFFADRRRVTGGEEEVDDEEHRIDPCAQFRALRASKGIGNAIFFWPRESRRHRRLFTRNALAIGRY